MKRKKVVIIGAGPAGLTAGYELIKKNSIDITILEKDQKNVGGLAKTLEYKGYRFDMGGHRFFSKSREINKLWNEIIGHKFMKVKRISRIYYNKKYFDYPLRPLNALKNLGLLNSLLILSSYIKTKIFPIKPEDNFEAWVTNRFGKKLYQTFFKTYTEKVWGIPCTKISSEWAAQRIKGLSLTSTVKNALFPQKKGKIKTLIEEFKYPLYGPGMLWEEMKNKITKNNKVIIDREVIEIKHNSKMVIGVVCKNIKNKKIFYKGDFYISSMPLRDLILALNPKPPKEVIKAAKELRYRSFLTIILIINKKEIFKDNWLYIHDPSVLIGRIQNFKNWSKYMVPNLEKTSLGLEYFCCEDDALWNTGDKELIELGKKEIHKIGLIDKSFIGEGCVIRMAKAYPMYTGNYRKALMIIREYLSKNLFNLQICGRYGMHKYNNMDHSMMTAILAAKNILGGNYNIWAVNTDAEYLEEEKREQE